MGRSRGGFTSKVNLVCDSNGTILAIWVIAILLFILGFIADMMNSKPIDPIGLGLTGARGALIWLLLCYGSLAGLFVVRFWQGKWKTMRVIEPAVVAQTPAS